MYVKATRAFSESRKLSPRTAGGKWPKMIEIMMRFFRWINLRASDDRQDGSRSQPKMRGRDDQPADSIVQQLFVQISQGGSPERKAWIKLAQYLGRQGSARPADLMHSLSLEFVFSLTNLR